MTLLSHFIGLPQLPYNQFMWSLIILSITFHIVIEIALMMLTNKHVNIRIETQRCSKKRVCFQVRTHCWPKRNPKTPVSLRKASLVQEMYFVCL